MPARMAAARIGSSRCTSKVRPAGWTVTVKLIVGRCTRQPEGLRTLVSHSALSSDPRPMTPGPAARARRPVLLIVGCGDIGLRVARLLRGRWRLLALTSSPARVPLLRAAGLTPLVGDLAERAQLMRLGGLADAVL